MFYTDMINYLFKNTYRNFLFHVVVLIEVIITRTSYYTDN